MKICKAMRWALLIVGLALAGCGQPSARSTPGAAPGGVPTPREAPQNAPGQPTPVPTVAGEPTAGLSLEDEIRAQDIFPEYYIEIDGQRIDGVVGGFCWPVNPEDRGPYVYCSDVDLPVFTPEERHLYTLGEPIQVYLEGPYPDVLDASLQQSPTLYTYDQAQIIPQGPTFRWTPEVEPGDYELVLYAQWFDDEADLVFYYPLTVVAADDASPEP